MRSLVLSYHVKQDYSKPVSIRQATNSLLYAAHPYSPEAVVLISTCMGSFWGSPLIQERAILKTSWKTRIMMLISRLKISTGTAGTNSSILDFCRAGHSTQAHQLGASRYDGIALHACNCDDLVSLEVVCDKLDTCLEPVPPRSAEMSEPSSRPDYHQP